MSSPSTSWHTLPTELLLAIIHLLPPSSTRALSTTSWAARSLCLPQIFANVIIPSCASLHAFVRHVPPRFGLYMRSLSICTKGTDPATGAQLGCTDAIVSILQSCTRLLTLSLSLASSLDAESVLPTFSRLIGVHTFQICCWGREDESPVSERLAVSLAASLPSLSHLTLSRITRSAIHVDRCDVPYDVPLVTNDFDVPPHPHLGTNLALPSLLCLPSLRTLEIRDTWLGCDTKIDLDGTVTRLPSLERLVLTGSMYDADTQRERQACTAWLHACASSLRSLELGSTLAMPPEPTSLAHESSGQQILSRLPRVSNIHINASRITADDFPSTLNVLRSCGVESITVEYEQADTKPECIPEKCPSDDDFARELALADLGDWKTTIEGFLHTRSNAEWSALRRVEVFLSNDIHASWEL